MERNEITCVASRVCDPAMTYNEYLAGHSRYRSFWRHSRPCPVCGQKLMVNGKEFACEKCGFVERY